MDTAELKKMTNYYVDDINKRLLTIESNVKKRNSWALIYDKIKANPSRTDENVLMLMTEHFGKDCLKSVIIQVAERYVKDYDDVITSQSCDLKMIVKPKTGNQ